MQGNLQTEKKSGPVEQPGLVCPRCGDICKSKFVDKKNSLFEYVLKKGKQIKMWSLVKIIAHKGGKEVMEI